MINSQWLSIIKTICDLPTAPFQEQHVMAWIRQYLETLSPQRELRVREDRAGNLFVDYGTSSIDGAGQSAAAAAAIDRRRLVFEAHVDHPGFICGATHLDGTMAAGFLGGVKPSCFEGATVRLFHPHGRSPWCRAEIIAPPGPADDAGAIPCTLRLLDDGAAIPAGTIGMWDLPDGERIGDYFAARVCDDLAGAAAMLCLLHEACERQLATPFTLMFTRAEEVGFIGTLAAMEDGSLATHGSADTQWSVIGLETSRALPHAPMGGGPVLRVGDRSSIFSSPLTRFIKLTADDVADDVPGFSFQRALMDGGTCNSSVFDAFGYDSAGLTLPMGNYHNMAMESIPVPVPRAGPMIASEVIHLHDFQSLVELLIGVVDHFPRYTGDHDGFRAQMMTRLGKHRAMLYAQRESFSDRAGLADE